MTNRPNMRVVMSRDPV